MATTNINVTTTAQDLQSVTDVGNITTNNIELDNSAIVLENGSLLQSGTVDNGAGGGMARVCSIGYQDEWENGIQYFLDNNSGQIIRANSINNTVPGVNHDITMGYIPGSVFHDMNNHNKYICTDNTDGDADWVLFYENAQPQTNTGLFAQTGNSTTHTGTSFGTLIDGGVGSLTVPANGFSVGDSFRVEMAGLLSAQNNNTITIRLNSNATVLADSPAFTLPHISGQVFGLSVNFTIRAIGAAGVASIVTTAQLHILKTTSGTQEGFAWNVVNNTTFNTTISNTLNIQAKFSSSSANNSIYSDIFILNKIY
jgi:hypothetical protein